MSYDNRKPEPDSNVFTTPCGRYCIERVGCQRFEVHGPKGFLNWFVTFADAKEFAEGQAEKNPAPIPQPKYDRHARRERFT